MSRDRADIGFGEALDGFDPADWSPGAAKAPAPRPPAEETRRTAEATGFVSRQAPGPERAGESPPPRRRRTGRNVQFNLKVRQDTIDRFCAIADARGWGLGETLEHAVALLQRTYGGGEKSD